MSSPLEGRIRTLAREEAAAIVGAQTADGTPGREDLQQQITDLHEHLHHAATTIKRLEDRVAVLEKATGQTDQEQRPTVRRPARKESGDKHPE